MKKYIALILVLALCLCLTACGQTKYRHLTELLDEGLYEEAVMEIVAMAQTDPNFEGNNNGDDSDDDVPDTNVNEEELRKQELYNNLVTEIQDLETTIANGSDLNWYNVYFWIGEETVDLYGMEALAYLHEQLLGLGDYENAAELASRFTVLDNKLLNITYSYSDALGNVNDGTEATYQYSADGRVSYSSKPHELMEKYDSYSGHYYTYDANGNLINMTEKGYDGTVYAILDVSYDANGNVLTEDYKDNNGAVLHVDYVYEEGRLVSLIGAPGRYGDISNYTYTYMDADRQLIVEAIDPTDEYWQYTLKTVYTYDANGNVATKRTSYPEYREGVMTYEGSVYEWAYTYDANGNILTAVRTHLGSFNENGECTTTDFEFTYTYTYNYGTYYVYTPAEG